MDTPLRNTVVSDLIGDIHECALDPARWYNALDRLRKAVNFRYARIDESIPAIDKLRISAASGLPPEWARRMEEHLAPDIVAIWRGKELDLDNYFGDDLHVLSRRNPSALSRGGRQQFAWREVAGIGDAIAIPLARNGNRIGAVGLSKAAGAGAITQAEVDIVRLFVPHLRRAAALQNAIEHHTVAAATFDAVLDRLSFAVVLVDADLRVVHANHVAEAMFANRNPLRSHGGTLRLDSQSATKTLVSAVCNIESVAAGGMHVPMPERGGGARFVHVLPLCRGHTRAGLSSRAVAALLVAPGVAPGVCIEAMRLLFDLTAAEAAVLEQIVTGRDVAGTARALGIGPNTVKTHLHRVFNKTGMRRQADLVALVSSLTLPLRD